MRDAERIEAQGEDPESDAENEALTGESDNSEQLENHRTSPWLKPWHFKPGKSGNPGGRPKRDTAQIIAQAVFDNNPELIYAAYTKALKKGSGFTFQVLSDRAFGKLKEKVEVSGDEELLQRLLAGRKRVSKK